MKILVAGYAYEDSFADNVASTLQEMGHEVWTFGSPTRAQHYAPLREFLRLATTRLLRSQRGFPDERKLLKLARRVRPDVILSLTREYSSETLSDLRKIGKPVRILWWGDSPANAHRMTLIDPGWDLIFMKDQAAVEKARLVRSDVHLLYEAMNPRWHRPLASQENDTVAVAGNWYGFRQALVNRLLQDGVSVACYGPRPPPHWSLPRILRAHQGRYIAREEKSRVFGAALACLNSFQFSEGNSLNCRAFEIAGTGGLQLIEYRPAVAECFEPGKELLVFRSYEELTALIEKARRDPSSMRRIREAGARRAIENHTYRHRLEAILSHLR
jgi:spore maturation protein CgeB